MNLDGLKVPGVGDSSKSCAVAGKEKYRKDEFFGHCECEPTIRFLEKAIFKLGFIYPDTTSKKKVRGFTPLTIFFYHFHFSQM